MIIVDSGPLVSYVNQSEGLFTEIAALVLEDDPAQVVVPWPVFTETDLFLRGRGYRPGAQALGEGLLAGELRLEQVTAAELALALRLLRQYSRVDLDLPDAVVMAMTIERGASAFTWDFRHFRAVVVERGVPIPLVVEEHQLRRRRQSRRRSRSSRQAPPATS